MPPAIQRMMTVSAVGVIFSSVSPKTWRGKPALRAESVAALAVFGKTRRVISGNELEFGEHGEGPKQIFDASGLNGFADDVLGEFEFGFSRLSTERSFVDGWDERLFGHRRIIEQIVSGAFEDIGESFAIGHLE